MNKKSIILFMVSFCALFSMLVLPNYTLAESTEINEATAKKQATDYVLNDQTFFNIVSDKFELELVREFYHTDDSNLAYYYHVKENDTLRGFIVASAKQDTSPVFESGQFFDNIDSHYGALLSENPNKNAYYLGLDSILFADNNKEFKNKVAEKKAKSIKKAKESGEDTETIQEMEAADLGLKIEEMNTPELQSQLSMASTTPNSYELSVTRLWQRNENVANPSSSCGPTTGAMIANYYGQVRGFDVRTTNNYTNVGSFINHLYFEMNAGLLGANSYSFLNGLSIHLNHDNSRWEGVRNGEPTYANVINAILKHYPVAYVSRWVAGKEYHWRVIKGYTKSAGEIVYKDSDGGESNYGDRRAIWSVIDDGITTVYYREV